jgi:hypothetical protein
VIRREDPGPFNDASASARDPNGIEFEMAWMVYEIARWCGASTSI